MDFPALIFSTFPFRALRADVDFATGLRGAYGRVSSRNRLEVRARQVAGGRRGDEQQEGVGEANLDGRNNPFLHGVQVYFAYTFDNELEYDNCPQYWDGDGHWPWWLKCVDCHTLLAVYHLVKTSGVPLALEGEALGPPFDCGNDGDGALYDNEFHH